MLPVIFFFMCILFSLPVIPVIRNGGILKITAEISKPLAKTVSLFYSGVFIWTAVISTARFALFMSTVMYGNQNLLFMITVFTAVAAISATRGTEALGRVSVILFAILILSLVFICFNTIDKADIANLTPPMYYGPIPVISAAFHSVTRTLEVTSLLFMGEKVNGKYLSACLKGLGFFTLTATVLFALISLVAGSFGNEQLFQLYTLTTISGSGMTEQLDAVIIGFWTLCAFVKSSFFIYLSVYTTENAFGYRAKNICYMFPALIICIISTLIAFSTTRFSAVISSHFYEAVFIISATVIPLIITIVCKIKSKKVVQLK